MRVKVKFYGTRGSIPTPGAKFSVYGGNTTCVMVTGTGGAFGILDAGSGIRVLGDELGERLAASVEAGVAQPIPILLSHTHWDHIQGFPFFKPAFDPRHEIRVTIHGRADVQRNLEGVFAGQMKDDYFPVPLTAMGAAITFDQADLSDNSGPGGSRIRASAHRHPGGAYGYRISGIERTICFCTDVEHGSAVDTATGDAEGRAVGKRAATRAAAGDVEGPAAIDQRVVDLARGADLLIHDAQYTAEQLFSKRGWGHSSWQQAVEVARRAEVGALALTHHDPDHDDEFIKTMERECRREYGDSLFARDGMEIDLG